MSSTLRALYLLQSNHIRTARILKRHNAAAVQKHKRCGAYMRSNRQVRLCDVDDLLAFVFAGLQAYVVRTNPFTGMRIFNNRRVGKRMVGTALVAAGFAGFFLWNCHGTNYFSVVLKQNPVDGRTSRFRLKAFTYIQNSHFSQV